MLLGELARLGTDLDEEPSFQHRVGYLGPLAQIPNGIRPSLAIGWLARTQAFESGSESYR
jgi:hypothetical protein